MDVSKVRIRIRSTYVGFLYLLAANSKELEPNQDVDLEAHFLRVRRLFLGSFAVASIFAVFDGSILSDEPLWDTGRGGQIVLIVAALAGLATKNKRAQTLVAAIVMIALVYITIMRQWNPR